VARPEKEPKGVKLVVTITHENHGKVLELRRLAGGYHGALSSVLNEAIFALYESKMRAKNAPDGS
jgi:hypothetical protein